MELRYRYQGLPAGTRGGFEQWGGDDYVDKTVITLVCGRRLFVAVNINGVVRSDVFLI